VSRYPDGGDDFSSCPYLSNDGYFDNERGLDNDGYNMSPWRAEVQRLCPNFHEGMLQLNLSENYCSTRSQYIFNAAANETIRYITEDYHKAAKEYGEAKQAYDANVQRNSGYWVREELDPSLQQNYIETQNN